MKKNYLLICSLHICLIALSQDVEYKSLKINNLDSLVFDNDSSIILSIGSDTLINEFQYKSVVLKIPKTINNNFSFYYRTTNSQLWIYLNSKKNFCLFDTSFIDSMRGTSQINLIRQRVVPFGNEIYKISSVILKGEKFYFVSYDMSMFFSTDTYISELLLDEHLNIITVGYYFGGWGSNMFLRKDFFGSEKGSEINDFLRATTDHVKLQQKGSNVGTLQR